MGPPPYSEVDPEKKAPPPSGYGQPYPGQNPGPNLAQPYPPQQALSNNSVQPMNYGQPLPGYSTQQPPQQMQIVVQQQPNPMQLQCPNCKQWVISKVEYETASGTWLICLAVCCFLGPFGCCLVPFCLDDCKDALHRCPACKAIIGRKTIFND